MFMASRPGIAGGDAELSSTAETWWPTGFRRQGEAVGDLGVGQALDEQVEDARLARGQPGCMLGGRQAGASRHLGDAAPAQFRPQVAGRPYGAKLVVATQRLHRGRFVAGRQGFGVQVDRARRFHSSAAACHSPSIISRYGRATTSGSGPEPPARR